MNKTHALRFVAAMLCAATAVFLWQTSRRTGGNSVSEPSRSVASAKIGASEGSRPKAGMPRSTAFAIGNSSLRGTEIDGSASFDANGEVALEPELRRLFDYYLSLIGERDLAQIRQLLVEHLLDRHGPSRAQKVMPYFDRYVAYQRRLTETRIGDAADPQERLAQAMVLRRALLGEEMATAFFAEEEALAVLTLKRMAIASDVSLTAQRKSERLLELDRGAGHNARKEADIASVVADQERRYDLAQMSASRRAAERETLWGKQAAERLAQLDGQRASWNARIERYLYARSRIDADRSLSSTARAQAVAALRVRHFDAAEQRRVASLEAIGQLKPGD